MHYDVIPQGTDQHACAKPKRCRSPSRQYHDIQGCSVCYPEQQTTSPISSSTATSLITKSSALTSNTVKLGTMVPDTVQSSAFITMPQTTMESNRTEAIESNPNVNISTGNYDEHVSFIILGLVVMAITLRILSTVRVCIWLNDTIFWNIVLGIEYEPGGDIAERWRHLITMPKIIYYGWSWIFRRIKAVSNGNSFNFIKKWSAQIIYDNFFTRLSHHLILFIQISMVIPFLTFSMSLYHLFRRHL